MPNPNFTSADMEVFDRSVARQFLSNYFPKKMMNYMLANLQLGQFQIWYGNGNNGKTALSEVVLRTLGDTKAYFISGEELCGTPVNRFMLDSRRILFVRGCETKIPAERLTHLLDAGFLIILEENTLPIIENPTESLWARTHAIRFKVNFTTGRIDPTVEQYTRSENLPYNMMATELRDWMNRLDILISRRDSPLPIPSRFVKALNQLKLLASYTPNNDKSKEEENKNSAMKCENNCVGPSLVIAEVAEAAEATDDYTFPRYGVVTIILQHTDESRPDDMLTIEVDPDSDGFIINWDQRYVGAKTTFYMSAENLDVYLNIFFAAARRDKDGYAHVQFSVPLFPTVMVNLADAGRYAEYNLAAQIEFLSDDWPCESTKGPFNTRT